MAVYNQWDRVAQQHLALRQQEASVLPAVVLVQHRHQPQVALAEAGLEAHLHQQQASVGAQDLEHQQHQQL
jgi:hypothetical protein